jgi:hypothetical protein
VVHTITSIAKAKWKSGFITKKDVLPSVKPVTSQRHDRHLRLIHLRNRMITAEDTVRRTPGLANVRISDHTVRRRLRESGLRTRHSVVGPILKQRHRTTRLTWVRVRVVGGFTLGNTSFLVMNPDFHFALAMDVIVCIKVVCNCLVSHSSLNNTHRSLKVILTEPWHQRSCENSNFQNGKYIWSTDDNLWFSGVKELYFWEVKFYRSW